MAKRFRDTDGREGLPNVDFCGSHRVPVWALRKLVDDALTPKAASNEVAPDASVPAISESETDALVEPRPLAKPKRIRRHQSGSDQSALFDFPPAS